MSYKFCETHGREIVDLVDNFQNFKQIVCPYCVQTEWRDLYEHGLQDRNELLTRIAALEARCIEAEQAEANSHRCHEATIVRCDAAEARCRDAAKLISDVVETPDQFETEWNKAAREWLASTSETSAEQASYLKTRDCEHDWKESTTKGWENCMNCGATRVIEKAKRTALNRSAKP